MSTPPPMAGWLLLDVDGPLNPYLCSPHRPPTGFTSWRRLPDGRDWLPNSEAKRRYRSRELRGGLLVWLNSEHGAALGAVAELTGLRLAWATTWGEEANSLIGPAIGLGSLPVIDFSDELCHDDDLPAWRDEGAWKYPAVAAFTGNAPVAWVDDEFGPRDHVEARAAFLADRQAPTLLRNVDPRHGITDGDLDAITKWAATLPGAR